MEPFSIAVSIAGLVSLAGSLVPLITAAHGAQDETASLVNELKTLQVNLGQLDAFLRSRTSTTASFQQQSLLVAQIASLTQNLLDLKQGLERTSRSRVRQAIWPLQQRDHQYHMNHIRAFSQLIHFALSIDTAALLSNTTNEMAGMLSQQIRDLELLESIPSQITTLNQAMNDQTTALEGIRISNERSDLLDWLSNDSQQKHHDRIRRTLADGTGQWVLNAPEFVQWMAGESKSSVLWCPGEMGSGKTTIASLLIDHLRTVADAEGSALAFYYFSYSEAHEQSIFHVMKSLIRQLLKNSKISVPQSLHELRARPGSETQTELEYVLEEAAQRYKCVYLVVDAIDEADAVQTLKPFLRFLDDFEYVNCMTLITGRPHRHEIDNAFMSYPSLSIKATEEDLRVFIESSIQKADFCHLFDTELSEEICEALVDSAQGLFLLPTLQLSRLLQEPTRGDIEDVLQDLPRSVFGALRGEMARILQQSRSRSTVALHTLMWLCIARDPMSAANLADILSLDLSQKRGLSARYRPSVEVVVECCHGLIQFDKRSDTYRLTHLAVREYLLAHQIEYFQDTMANLVAKSCLLYVLDPVFDDGPVPVTIHEQAAEEGHGTAQPSEMVEAPSAEGNMNEAQEIVNFVNKHPFLMYFARNWGWHVQDILKEAAIRSLVTRFLDSQPRLARVSQVDHFLSGYRHLYWSLQEVWSMSGAILASYFGLKEIVCEILDAQKEQVDYATSIGTTALIVAASKDHLELVRELLQRKADPLRRNWYGNALHCAAERNAVSVLKELLSTGIDVNVASPLGRTALSCTVDHDCEDAAEELLKQEATMWYETIRPRASLMERIKMNQYLQEVRCPFLVEIMYNGAARTLSMLIERRLISKKEAVYTGKVISVMEEKGCISAYEASGLTKGILFETLHTINQDKPVQQGGSALHSDTR